MQPSDEIKQKLDIVDIIKEYIPLQQAGMNFRACCPFHREKTPSFMVSPDKQIYHCFGCGKGGDLISFVMDMEGVDFVEALRILAPKAGVTLKRQDPKVTSKRNKLLDIMDLTSKYYYKVLVDTNEGEWARNYLKGRNLQEETIDEWRVGYSFEAWDKLLNFLKKRGFQENDLVDAGVILKSNKNNKYFDRFRDRIMFPIADINGNVVAFSARINPAKEDIEKMGKYINSPQTFLYDKSNILFGLDKARSEIRQLDYSIVVEGQMDVITAHQAGFKNVVASSGTALTKNQIILLKRYSKNIMLAFDMDKAGEMAAERGIREAIVAEMNIKVVELPNGKDPDDCINNNVDDWVASVKNAKPMMEYFINKKIAGISLNDITAISKAVKQLIPYLSVMGSQVEKDYWLRYLSQKTNIEEHTLLTELKKQPKGNNLNSALAYQSNNEYMPDSTQNIPQEPAIEKRTIGQELSDLTIAFVLKHYFLFEYFVEKVQEQHLSGLEAQDIYKKLLMYYNTSTHQESKNINVFDYNGFKTWSQEEFTNKDSIDSNQFKYLDKLVLLGEKEFSDVSEIDAKPEFIRIFSALKKLYYKAEMKNIERTIADLERAGDEDKMSAVLEELKRLSDELIQLDKI